MRQRLSRAESRILTVLRLARRYPYPVFALDLMDATGLGPGRLYPALARLNQRGIVRDSKAGKRVAYALTEYGWDVHRCAP